ncbi:MAG TPA: NfeD family protein [Candidatus Thermoplasmatota archaeon]|nr:NfeD family protein [Candidatus Thermoplasmatota archaeon]
MRALRVVPLVLLAALAGASWSSAQAQAPLVLHLTIDGAIGSATAEYVREGLAAARTRGAAAVVLTLNTPGGELGATFAITDAIVASEVPVVGFVHPQHAVAWSAGTVILLSTHRAAMAPNTVIGSSQPVSLGGGGFAPVNDSKIINALVAKVRELAVFHGRNTTAAEAFVTENLNLNASAALAAGVTEDDSSFSIPQLLARVDGTNVTLAGGRSVTLSTEGAVVEPFERSIRILFTELLQNPLLSSLFLLVGIYALIFGLSSPGLGAEVAGLVLILLALAGLGFDVNLAALGLLALGAVLLLVEIHSPGFGAIGGAGVVSLVLGALLLVPVAPRGPEGPLFPAEYQTMVMGIVLVPALGLALFLGFAGYKVVEVRKRKVAVGGPVEGEIAVVLEAMEAGGSGFVSWKGERWIADTEDDLAAGENAEIVRQEGLRLRVRKPRPPAPDPAASL